MSARRALRPRVTATLPVQPVTCTDLNAPAVVGLEPRQFRQLVTRLQVPHTRLGQRMIVRLDVLLGALALAETGGIGGEPAELAGDGDGARDDGDGPSVDALLARVGMERR